MKRLRMGLAGVVMGVLMVVTNALYAQETPKGLLDGFFGGKPWEVSGDVNFSSIYMWRGIMLDGDAVVQPGLYVRSPESKLGRIKLGVWFSHDLINRDVLHSSETDLIFDYTYNFQNFDLSVGHTYYDFPDALPTDGGAKGFSKEMYAGFAIPKLFLSPSVYYYYDYGKKEEGGGEGSYVVLNLAKSIPFDVKGLNMSLDLSGHVGHNNKLYYRGKGGDAAITAGVTIPLIGKLMCKPNVSYSVPWGNISDKGNGNQKARVYTGAYLSYSF